MNHQLINLERRIQRLESLLWKKTSGGSADIKGDIVPPSTVTVTIGSNSVNKAAMTDDSVGNVELDYETVAVTVSAGQTSGTGTATSGSVIIGWRPTGNIDQFVDNIAISGTTVTVTLGAAATVDNTFSVILLKV